MDDPLRLHRDAIIIDATCPLARSRQYLDWWREGGATAIAPTITGMSGNAQSGLREIGGWHRYVRERDDTLIDNIAEAFRVDELPEPIRKRLLHQGFVRLDAAGLFAADRYIMPEQIDSVSGEGLMLNVSRDELIKRH